MYSQSKIYWVSWKRVLVVTGTIGLVGFLLGYYSSLKSGVSLYPIFLTAALGTICLTLLMGSTFLRVTPKKIYYVNTLFSFTKLDINKIATIKIVPRFFFTNKATSVLIEKKNEGAFPGMLISRDAFPDEKIIALVKHLKQLNPTIELDEKIQSLLDSAATT